MLSIPYKGKRITIGELSLLTGKSPESLYKRIQRGDTAEDCFLPKGSHKAKLKYEYSGFLYTVDELAYMARLGRSTIYRRLYKCKSIKEVMGFVETENLSKVIELKSNQKNEE